MTENFASRIYLQPFEKHRREKRFDVEKYQHELAEVLNRLLLLVLKPAFLDSEKPRNSDHRQQDEAVRDDRHYERAAVWVKRSNVSVLHESLLGTDESPLWE